MFFVMEISTQNIMPKTGFPSKLKHVFNRQLYKSHANVEKFTAGVLSCGIPQVKNHRCNKYFVFIAAFILH
jgi:hypothetical protein